MQKSKILFVGAFPPSSRKIYGGMVSSCRALLNSSLPSLVELILVDSTQISNPAPSFPFRLLLAVRRFILFLYKFEKNRPDCVWLFTALGGSLLEKGLMSHYANFRGAQSVMFPRGGELMHVAKRSRFQKFWIRLAFGGAHKIVCQGKTWQYFVSEVLELGVERAPIVENWTASSSLLKIGSSRSVVQSEVDPRLLFVGWLEKEKGIFELLRACSELRKKFKFSLEIVGSGSQIGNATDEVEFLEMSEIVTFSGWLDGQDLELAYARSDILVLPSWAEGFPNVIVESLACRMAVVSTTVGVIPDILADGEQALLVPPKDINSLLVALENLLVDQKLRFKLADNGYRLALENWGVERAVERLLDLSEVTLFNNRS